MTVKRILHTSDWHLGQTFHDAERTWEHEQFLSWLRGTLREREVDALLVTGDIFDTATPSSVAQRQWFDFLAGVVRDRPQCDVVAIAGNHDSAQRLDAPEALTRALGLTVVGSARDANGDFQAERLVVPLGARSEVGTWGWAATLPFLRGDDLGTLAELHVDDAYEGLVRRRHEAVFAHLGTVAKPGHARFALGHGVVLGSERSPDSERAVRIGNAEGFSVDVFPADLTYVALGHLHRPQRVGGKDHVRYAGSPLPLHVSEAEYAHQVVLITVDDGALISIEPLLIPKAVAVVRVPAKGRTAPPDEVLAELRLLTAMGSLPEVQRPWLAVRFLLETPRPGFADEVVRAIEGKGYRLTTVEADRPKGEKVEPLTVHRRLQNLEPIDVFRALYKRHHPDTQPSLALEQAFRELEQRLAEESGS